MRKLFFLSFILCVALLLNGCGKKDGTSDKKEGKTEQKKDISFSEGSSYHLKYESKSGKEKGTMDFYFKNKNAKIDMNFIEGDKKNNALMYFADKVVYMITEMEGKKVGMKMDISESKEADMDIVNVKEKLKDYEKIGSDEVLGYNCDVYKTKEGTKLSIYKEVFALKIVDNKNNEYVATAFEQDVKLADDFFAPPKDVEYMDFSKLGNMK
ncbi:MAG: DUF4412 domain-containing protein [Ignavibacteria bacterium]|jgi:major membrane immunogen (membrane-anchored lipoprotein)